MLPNEEFALACRARYEQMGLVVDRHNGEFAHCPLPIGMGDSGYYLLHDDHQHQGLLQSRDVGKCCFFAGHAKKWLMDCKEFPERYFELWGIYEKYAGENIRNMHAERDESGKSLFTLKLCQKIHAERDENGRSLHALKLNAEKDEHGRSIIAAKGGEAAKLVLQKKIQLTRITDGAIFVFDSGMDAARALNLTAQNLSQVCRGKRKSVKGFTARYLAPAPSEP